MNLKTLIVIIGPTAIGKTSLAIDVAKHFNSEIISSDSRQFYKEMQIGTAVPSSAELATITHHFIQHLSIHQNYSVGDFEREAVQFIHQYFKKKEILVMVGGSGLYEKAVTQGLDNFPDVPEVIRNQIQQEFVNSGLEPLQRELKTKDEEYYATADIQNPQRVIRALELIRFTGKPFSDFRNNQIKKRNFNIIKIGLNTERSIIYDRINQRVDNMIDEGLINEAKKLHPYKNLNALQTVGYKELFDYIEGKTELEFAISEIKKNTRRFAKRQLTWYRKDKQVNWFAPNENQQVILFIHQKLAENGDKIH